MGRKGGVDKPRPGVRWAKAAGVEADVPALRLATPCLEPDNQSVCQGGGTATDAVSRPPVRQGTQRSCRLGFIAQASCRSWRQYKTDVSALGQPKLAATTAAGLAGLQGFRAEHGATASAPWAGT